MKRTKKYFALAIALIMALALAVPAFATNPDEPSTEPADEPTTESATPAALPSGTAGVSKTITITPDENTPDGMVVTYTIYKVFDATSGSESGADNAAISYQKRSNHDDLPAGFTYDDSGRDVVYSGTGTALTDTDIAAIAAYVTNDDIVGTTTTTGKAATTVTVPDYGYYYITTTTGTLVTINSTNPAVSVINKNPSPSLDKSVTEVGDGTLDADGQSAVAQVGTTVSFKITVDVKAGAENYVVNDTMDNLDLDESSVKVFVDANSNNKQDEDEAVPATAYTLTKTAYAVADGETTGKGGFTLSFDNDSITDYVNKTITITYDATIMDEALDTNSVENTASLKYGDPSSPTSTPASGGDDIDIKTATITINKHDGNTKLAGVKFVLKKGEQFYKVSDNKVEWVDAQTDATEVTTDNNGAAAFKGLSDGTYTLVETAALPGYNVAANQDFTIAANNTTDDNIKQTADVVNNQGQVLPSTGGIGTTIFYVTGSVLVLAAVIFFVTKRRVA